MAFNWFKKKEVDPLDVDYITNAETFEKAGDFTSAVGEYQKAISIIYDGKPASKYKHLTKKIVDCYVKLGDFDKVFELWPLQYDSDYSAHDMFDLIKVLEAAGRIDLVNRVYDQAGSKLAVNKVDFLIKQKRIPEANELMSAILINLPETAPGIFNLWTTKAKLCLSLKKWEEANKYINKMIDRDPHNMEARKLKEFCMKQIRNG